MTAFDIQDFVWLAYVAVFSTKVKDTSCWTVKAILLGFFDKGSLNRAAGQIVAAGTLEYMDLVVTFGN